MGIKRFDDCGGEMTKGGGAMIRSICGWAIALFLSMTWNSAFAAANYVFHNPGFSSDNPAGHVYDNASNGSSLLGTTTVYAGDYLALRLKVEYNGWIDTAKLRYTVDGSNPSFGGSTTEVNLNWIANGGGDPQPQVWGKTDAVPPQTAGTTIRYVLYSYHSGGGVWIYANGGNDGNHDDVSEATIFSKTVSALNNPAVGTLTADSGTQITLNWTRGTSGSVKDTVIVRNTTGTFTTPSGAPPGNGNAFAGGTQVYYNNGTSVADTGLTPGVTYYYKFFSINNNYYSSGATGSQSTPATPTITVSSGSTTFTNVPVNSTSANQSYTVSGLHLIANLTLTAPAGFEISTAAGSGFGSSITLSPSSGTVPSTTIYVRFKPTAVTAYSGNITHASTGATTQNNALTGTGIAPVNPASFSASGGILQNSVSFTLGADSKPVVIVYDADNSFSAPSGAPPSAGAAFAGGTVLYNGTTSPQIHSSLSAGQLVYYKAFSYDSVGDFYSAGLSANAATLPPVPTASAATSVGHLTFTANWSASAGATDYLLDVSYDSGFSSMVSGYSSRDVDNVTSYGVTVPAVGVYYYRVRAQNGAGTTTSSGTITVYSTQAQGQNKSGSATPYYKNSANVDQGTIYLGDTATFGLDTWATISGHQGRHRVVIDTDANIGVGGLAGSYSGFDSTDYNEAVSPTFTSVGTWYWGMQLDYGGTYGTNFWMVRNVTPWAALYYNGTNGNLTVTVTALSDPTGVSATKDGTLPAEKINLSWTRWNSRNVMVVRSTGAIGTPANGTAYTAGQSIPGGGTVVYNGALTSFADTGLSAATTYNYKFFSENFSYYSAGATDSETTDAAPAPSAPVATAATGIGLTGFTANWNASAGATSYRLDVSRNLGFTDLVLSDSNVGNVTTYAVGSLPVGQYYYRVRAANGGGTSASSSIITTGTSTAQGRNKNGGAPYVSAGTIYVGDTVNVGVDTWESIPFAVNGRGRAVIDTDANLGSGGLYGSWGGFDFVVYTEVATPRFTSAGTWYWGVQMEYSNLSTDFGTNFWMVRNSAGYIDLYYAGTNGDLTVTVTALSNPTGVSATQNVGSPGSAIDLAWTRWNIRDVMVVRSLDATFTAPTPGVVYSAGQTIGGDTVVYKGSGTSFTDTGLGGGSTYTYRFYSENFGYYSAGTDDDATTAGSAPDAPTASAATAIGTTSFQANWSASLNATGYELDVSTVNTFPSYVSGYNDKQVAGTSDTVSGLTAGNTYYYRVRAKNAAGTSLSSSTITVVMPSSLDVNITSIPSAGLNGTVTWSAESGVSYDVYYSDNGTSWTFDETVAAVGGSANAAAPDPAAGGTRMYKVVLHGQSAPSSTVNAWGVSKPTIKGSTMTLLSPPLESDLDFGVGGQLGAELAEVLEPGDKIQILTPGTTSFTTLELNGSGQWIGSVTTLNPGQGFFVEKASAGDVTVRMTGQVGNDGASQNTLKVGYNVIGLSEGKNLAASSAFESADPEENYNGELADQVILQNSDGSWRRLIRRPPGVWYDTTTRANTTLQLTPGQAYYYLRRAGDATVSF